MAINPRSVHQSQNFVEAFGNLFNFNKNSAKNIKRVNAGKDIDFLKGMRDGSKVKPTSKYQSNVMKELSGMTDEAARNKAIAHKISNRRDVRNDAIKDQIKEFYLGGSDYDKIARFGTTAAGVGLGGVMVSNAMGNNNNSRMY